MQKKYKKKVKKNLVEREKCHIFASAKNNKRYVTRDGGWGLRQEIRIWSRDRKNRVRHEGRFI